MGSKKRSLDAPLLANSELDPETLGKQLVENFVKMVVPVHKKGMFKAFVNDPIDIEPAAFDDWMIKLSPGVRKMVKSNVLVHLRLYNRFSFMVKGSVKPPLERSCVHKYASVQTISYMKKSENAIFSPLMRVLFERMLAVLDDKILIMTGMSKNEFEHRMNEILMSDFVSCVQIENDMTKFESIGCCQGG